MTPRDLGTLLVLAGVWGSSFLFIRMGVDAMPPLLVVQLRLVLGALGAGVFLVVLRVPGAGSALRRPLVLLTGVCSMAVPFALYAYGETRVSSGIAGISNATAPLFAAVIAQAVPLGRGGERLTRRRAAGLLIGFAGVCVLASDGIRGDLDTPGLLMCVGAPVFYGVGAILAKNAYRDLHPIAASVSGTALAALALLPITLVAGRPDHNPGARALLAVAALGVLGTGFAFILFYRLLARIGSTTFTVTYLMPVVAVVEGTAFLGETMRWTDVAALAGILVGVGVANGVLPPAMRRGRTAPAAGGERVTAPAETAVGAATD